MYSWTCDAMTKYDGCQYGLGWSFAYELLTGAIDLVAWTKPGSDAKAARLWLLTRYWMSVSQGMLGAKQDEFWTKMLFVVADHPNAQWPPLPLFARAPHLAGTERETIRAQRAMPDADFIGQREWGTEEAHLYSGSFTTSNYLKNESIFSPRMQPFMKQLLSVAMSVCEKPGGIWTAASIFATTPIDLHTLVPNANKRVVLDIRKAAERYVETFVPLAALSNHTNRQWPLLPPWAPAHLDQRTASCLSASELDAMAGGLLSDLPGVRELISRVAVAEVSGDLPFDITGARGAGTAIAATNLERLGADLKTYASQVAGESTADIVSIDAAKLVKGGKGAQEVAKTAVVALRELQKVLETEQASNVQLMSAGIAELRALTKQPYASATQTTPAELDVMLMRMQGQLADYLVPEVAFGAQMSSKPAADLRRLSPLLSDEAVSEALAISSCVQFRGLMVRHIGRALRMTTMLREALEALPRVAAGDLKDRCLVLAQDAKLLAQTLTTRHYVVDRESGLYNPQYITFEFSSGFALRKRQVEIVEDIVRRARRGESSVHQMIMGAGKTTMIMPLIALALADGTRLVTAVVPGPLLDMSTTVLRSRFGAIFPKVLSHMTFNRATGGELDATIKLFNRVMAAILAGGVLMTTPEAIKSLYLKFVELQLTNEELGASTPPPPVPSGRLWYLPNDLLGSEAGWATSLFDLTRIDLKGTLDVEAERYNGAVARMEVVLGVPLPRVCPPRDNHKCELIFEVRVQAQEKKLHEAKKGAQAQGSAAAPLESLRQGGARGHQRERHEW
jgi:hypothetical protein